MLLENDFGRAVFRGRLAHERRRKHKTRLGLGWGWDWGLDWRAIRGSPAELATAVIEPPEIMNSPSRVVNR